MSLQAAQAATAEGDDQGDDEELCVVCWEREREVIFYQCMHMVRSCDSEITLTHYLLMKHQLWCILLARDSVSYRADDVQQVLIMYAHASIQSASITSSLQQDSILPVAACNARVLWFRIFSQRDSVRLACEGVTVL